MADDCGRVNPVTPQFLGRDDREGLYRSRHVKKNPKQVPDGPSNDGDETTVEDAEGPGLRNRIDLRI
jgi:hypothetical protein